MSHRCSRSCSFSSFVAMVILLLTSCTSMTEPYSILEFSGVEGINNFSKSYFLMLNESDSINPNVIMGSRGDLFWCDEYLFRYNGISPQNKFKFKSTDSVLYVNDKIISIDIPVKGDTVPWFKNLKEHDFSALQFINVNSKITDSYLTCLTDLAKIKPDAGIFLQGDLEDMAGLLKIFNPRTIIGTFISRSDYDQLSKLTNLEMLMISLTDSVITDPLPFMPALKQLFLTELNDNIELTNDFLVNNKQIEKLVIQKSGELDLSILQPLDNLKELVINISDNILNFNLINDNARLEVLSVTGDNLAYNPNQIKLPLLRWMAFSSNVTQEEFNSFIDTHPDLEVIELIENDTIGSLKALSKLSKLYGLTVNDTITDIEAIKTLGKLRYLSLPKDFLDDPVKKAEIQKSLPDTQIAVNEGFCLGSGWLLLIIPLVLITRFFRNKERHKIRNEIES